MSVLRSCIRKSIWKWVLKWLIICDFILSISRRVVWCCTRRFVVQKRLWWRCGFYDLSWSTIKVLTRFVSYSSKRGNFKESVCHYSMIEFLLNANLILRQSHIIVLPVIVIKLLLLLLSLLLLLCNFVTTLCSYCYHVL